jgi:chromosome segregation ATPase
MRAIECDESNDSNQEFKSDFNNYLEALAQSFAVLNIKGNDVSELSHNIAIIEKVMESAKIVRLIQMNEQIETKLKELNDSIEDMKLKLKNASIHMKRESNFEQQVMNKINFYDARRKEFQALIKKKESDLNNIGFNEKLENSAIEQMKKNNSQLKDNLVSIKDKINFYDFAPNNESLQEKIDQMKRKINEIDSNFF